MPDTWTTADVVALSVGIAAAAISIVSIVQQWILWRWDGPILRVHMHPATLSGDRIMIGMNPQDVAGASRPAVAVSLYSTGRQPAFVNTLVIVAMAPMRKRLWRVISMQRLRARFRLVGPAKGEPMFIPDPTSYVTREMPPSRVDVSQRIDYLIDRAALDELERRAKLVGLSGRVRSLVVLGNSAAVWSEPFVASKPPISWALGLEAVSLPLPNQEATARSVPQPPRLTKVDASADEQH